MTDWRLARYKRWEAAGLPRFGENEPPSAGVQNVVFDLVGATKEHPNAPIVAAVEGSCAALIDLSREASIDGTNRPETVVRIRWRDPGDRPADAHCSALFALFDGDAVEGRTYGRATAESAEAQQEACLPAALELLARAAARDGVPLGPPRVEDQVESYQMWFCLVVRTAALLTGDAWLPRFARGTRGELHRRAWAERGYLQLDSSGAHALGEDGDAHDLAEALRRVPDRSVTELGQWVARTVSEPKAEDPAEVLALLRARVHVDRILAALLDREKGALALDPATWARAREPVPEEDRNVITPYVVDELAQVLDRWSAGGLQWHTPESETPQDLVVGGSGAEPSYTLRIDRGDWRRLDDVLKKMTSPDDAIPIRCAVAPLLEDPGHGLKLLPPDMRLWRDDNLQQQYAVHRDAFVAHWRERGDARERGASARRLLGGTEDPAGFAPPPLDLVLAAGEPAIAAYAPPRLASVLRIWRADRPPPRRVADAVDAGWWADQVVWVLDRVPGDDRARWADVLTAETASAGPALRPEAIRALWGVAGEDARGRLHDPRHATVLGDDPDFAARTLRAWMGDPRERWRDHLPAPTAALLKVVNADRSAKEQLGWSTQAAREAFWRLALRRAELGREPCPKEDGEILRAAMNEDRWPVLLEWPEPEARAAILSDLWLHALPDTLRDIDPPDPGVADLIILRALDSKIIPQSQGPAWEGLRQDVVLWSRAERLELRAGTLASQLDRIKPQDQTTLDALEVIGWDQLARRASSSWAKALWQHVRGGMATRQFLLSTVPLHLRPRVIEASGGRLPLDYAWRTTTP